MKPSARLGLILGIVAVVQSKKAGVKNGVGVAAIIVGAVLSVLWIIIWIIIALTTAAVVGGGIAELTELAQLCASGADTVEWNGQLIDCSTVDVN